MTHGNLYTTRKINHEYSEEEKYMDYPLYRRLRHDPYRYPEDTEKEKPIGVPPFEAKIAILRDKIPGPVRRLLGIFLFFPILILSFVVAVFLAIPIFWVVYGDFRFLEKSSRQNGFAYAYEPYLSGTYALFGKNSADFYQKIKNDEIKHYSK